MKKVFKICSMLLILLTVLGVGILSAQTTQPTTQKKPLTLTNILVALGSQKIQDMDEKNRILIEAVIDRGVTFAVTPEIEGELKRAGASDTLITTIKMKTQASQPANPQPTPAPQPQMDYTVFEKRADSYVQRGKYELAIPLYDQAITLSPKTSSLYIKRGFALFNTQDYDLALADYNKAIDLNPKDASAFFYRAQLHEKSGNLEEALEDYQKAVELDSNNEQAKNALKNLTARLPKPTPSPPQSQVASTSTTPPVQPPVTPPKESSVRNPEPPKTSENQATKTQPKNEPKVEPKNEPKNEPKTETKTESQSEASKTQSSSSKPQVTEEQINTIINSDFSEIVIGVGQITSSDIVRLVRPVYPQVAQRAGIGGQVKVEVTWDEQGKVISAKAVEGHSLLRVPCEDAAKKSEFKPKTIEGKPVKARGFLVYNFAR